MSTTPRFAGISPPPGPGRGPWAATGAARLAATRPPGLGWPQRRDTPARPPLGAKDPAGGQDGVGSAVGLVRPGGAVDVVVHLPGRGAGRERRSEPTPTTSAPPTASRRTARPRRAGSPVAGRSSRAVPTAASSRWPRKCSPVTTIQTTKAAWCRDTQVPLLPWSVRARRRWRAPRACSGRRAGRPAAARCWAGPSARTPRDRCSSARSDTWC